MLEAVLGFFAKALITAVVLFIISLVSERLGPFMASVLLTLPANAGPGYFFLSLEVSPEFLSEGALQSFAATGGVLAFTGCYIQSTRCFHYIFSILLSSLGWASAVWLFRFLEPSLVNSLIGVGLGALVGISMRRKLDVFSRPRTARGGRALVLVRSLAGGMTVAGIATAAEAIGPAVTGLLFGFPVTFIATSWMLSRQYGLEFSAATLQSAQFTLPAFAGFCLVLHFAADPVIGRFSGLQSWGLGIAASMLIGIAIAGIGEWFRRASRAS